MERGSRIWEQGGGVQKVGGPSQLCADQGEVATGDRAWAVLSITLGQVSMEGATEQAAGQTQVALLSGAEAPGPDTVDM